MNHLHIFFTEASTIRYWTGDADAAKRFEDETGLKPTAYVARTQLGLEDVPDDLDLLTPIHDEEENNFSPSKWLASVTEAARAEFEAVYPALDLERKNGSTSSDTYTHPITQAMWTSWRHSTIRSHARMTGLKAQVETLKHFQAESLEQARLLGISGSKEARLLTEIEQLKRAALHSSNSSSTGGQASQG